MVGRRNIAAVLVAAALAVPVAAHARPWLRVQSPHFTVSGSVSEREARDVAAKLEQFRQILLGLFPGLHLSMRPLFVIAFDSDRAFRPYKPRRDGQPAPVAGYFTWNSDGSCVALQLDRGPESYPIIFHEYTHLLLTQASRRVPSWLSEGLSEYYSTVELVDAGQRANIGRAVVDHLLLLQEEFMSVRDLLSVTRASTLWANRDEAALFYAESWALVHFLSSRPGGQATIWRYIEQVGAGRPEIDAFEQVFGPVATLEISLRQYVQNTAYRYWRYDLPRRVDAGRAPARRMTAGEVEATLAIPLIHLGRLEEGEVHVEAALKASPGLAEAYTAQGLLLRRKGTVTAAERALRTAVEKGPGNLDAAYYWGLSLAEIRDSERADFERALDAITAALPPDDPPADVLMVLGVLQGLTGRMSQADTTLRRSMTLAPGETRTRVALADIYIRQERFVEARALLEPMIAHPGYAGEADIARTALDWLVKEEADAKARKSITESQTYRQLAPGERRQPALLERIDCSPAGLVLRVTTTKGPMSFHAGSFADVQFISHREDLRGPVRCGPRPDRDQIFVIWRAATESLPASLGPIDGQAVAVEFLPNPGGHVN